LITKLLFPGSAAIRDWNVSGIGSAESDNGDMKQTSKNKAKRLEK